jgi:hypothetical protein
MEARMAPGTSGVLRGAAPVPWLTVIAIAVLMDAADNFWLTSIQGAVGAIERVQTPFASWLRTSVALLPLFLLAVLAGLRLARRRFGRALRTTRQVLAAALIVVAAGTVVGTGELAVSAAYDYHLQSRQLEQIHATHASAPHEHGGCSGLCAAQRATLSVDTRAAWYGSGVVLGTNLLVVGWVLALRGGRLDPRRRPAPPGVPEPGIAGRPEG